MCIDCEPYGLSHCPMCEDDPPEIVGYYRDGEPMYYDPSQYDEHEKEFD